MYRIRIVEIVLVSVLLLCASCNEPIQSVGCGKQKPVTLILGAFDAEVKPILEVLEDKREGNIEGIGFVKGKLRSSAWRLRGRGLGK